MIELHRLLNLKANTPKDVIKNKYHQSLYKLHPSNRHSGDEKAFIQLQEAYKQFLTGDSYESCFAVVENTAREFDCRCSGRYKIPLDYVGRIECEFCSCFIEVEEPHFILDHHK